MRGGNLLPEGIEHWDKDMMYHRLQLDVKERVLGVCCSGKISPLDRVKVVIRSLFLFAVTCLERLIARLATADSAHGRLSKGSS
jgi:hypothetical protein